MAIVKKFSSISLTKEDIRPLLEDKFEAGSPVVIKLHFGEPGNNTAFYPEDIKPYVEAIEELGFEVLMVDTPVAYNSPRSTKKGYEKAIKERGYNDIGNYVVSDEYVKSKVGGWEFEVAKELAEAKNCLVISHVKGHECAGFGGAIKNLGMGGLSKKSKGFIHSGSKPIVDESLCIGCGLCSNLCPAKAISMESGKANPSHDMCWGCSICEINCPVGALKPIEGLFDMLLAYGAVSAMNLMPKNTCYFNVIKNITKSCDCESDSGHIIAKDVGTLFSEDPVAIDCASVDLIREQEGKEPFIESNNKDPMLQINFAMEVSDFSTEYKLN